MSFDGVISSNALAALATEIKNSLLDNKTIRLDFDEEHLIVKLKIDDKSLVVNLKVPFYARAIIERGLCWDWWNAFLDRAYYEFDRDVLGEFIETLADSIEGAIASEDYCHVIKALRDVIGDIYYSAYSAVKDLKLKYGYLARKIDCHSYRTDEYIEVTLNEDKKVYLKEYGACGKFLKGYTYADAEIFDYESYFRTDYTFYVVEEVFAIEAATTVD